MAYQRSSSNYVAAYVPDTSSISASLASPAANTPTERRVPAFVAIAGKFVPPTDPTTPSSGPYPEAA